MTCCVAAICGDGKSLVLVADKMIGVGYVEAEPEIEKLQRLHPRWWVMVAGDDMSPAFPIIDHAKELLAEEDAVNVDSVSEAIKLSCDKQRADEAEAIYLKPRGWTLERFSKEGNQLLPDARELSAKIDAHELSIQLIVAGFNPNGDAYIVSFDGSDKRGVPRRHDLPGFTAIGSGGIGAVYMMFYRSLSPKTKAREALYYALEAKYFGEQASGVGASTDMYIARPKATIATAGSSSDAEPKVTKINDDEIIEKKLIKMCEDLEPRELREKDVRTLNELPELEDLPKLEWKPKTKKKVVAPASASGDG